jgi:hypothetical protein
MNNNTYNNILNNLNDQQKSSMPTFHQFKLIVKHKHEIFYKPKGYQLSHVYNELSKEYGFKNWNTLSAFLKENDKRNGICSSCGNTGVVGKHNKPCKDCTGN